MIGSITYGPKAGMKASHGSPRAIVTRRPRRERPRRNGRQPQAGRHVKASAQSVTTGEGRRPPEAMNTM
jgi:hypothetical protein